MQSICKKALNLLRLSNKNAKDTKMDYTDILINIRKIVRSLNLESKRIQKEHGISIPQLLCLNYLAGREGNLSTVTGISKYLNLNLSTTTGIINRLEKKGYVARLPKKNDRRVTPVALTSRGARLLIDSPELLHEQLSRKLKKLPEEKISQINHSLTVLLSYLNIQDMDASPIITIEDPIITIKDPDGILPESES